MTAPVIRNLTAEECTCRNDHPHLDEFIASGVSIHLEQMNDCAWWIGVTDAAGKAWSINVGSVSGRAKGYAMCEEDA